jgi:pimeloyl-ACP methyl ester carboxylesterase
VGLDWIALKASPVYYGIGVPRGDGAAVILVPGFLGSDLSLLEMHLWLGRIGYRSYLAGIGRIADCPDVMMERLLETIDRAHRETGREVRLIGHSLGGLLARAAAVRRPHQVAQVVTMASPFRRLSAHPLVLTLVKLVRGRALDRHFGEVGWSCECSFEEALTKPMPDSVAHTAIYTKTDPVVDWRDCVESDRALNIEVRGTHVGLSINAQVYREVSRLLARAGRVRNPDRSGRRSEPDLRRAA